MIEVKRKPNEPISSMLRRFVEILKKEKKIERTKELRFRKKPKSKTIIKKEALRRKVNREKKEYLRKIGVQK